MSSTVSVPQTPRFCTHLSVKRLHIPFNDDGHFHFTLRIRKRRYHLAWDCARPAHLRIVGGGDIADILSAAGRAHVLAQIYRLVDFPAHLQPALPATAAAWEVAR